MRRHLDRLKKLEKLVPRQPCPTHTLLFAATAEEAAQHQAAIDQCPCCSQNPEAGDLIVFTVVNLWPREEHLPKQEKASPVNEGLEEVSWDDLSFLRQPA